MTVKVWSCNTNSTLWELVRNTNSQPPASNLRNCNQALRIRLRNLFQKACWWFWMTKVWKPPVWRESWSRKELQFWSMSSLVFWVFRFFFFFKTLRVMVSSLAEATAGSITGCSNTASIAHLIYSKFSSIDLNSEQNSLDIKISKYYIKVHLCSPSHV